MAYSTSSPPVKLVDGVMGGGAAGRGGAVWFYMSADDDATVMGAGYVSNAQDLGMKVGDFVLIYDTTNTKGSVAFVTAVSSSGSTMGFAAVS